MDCCFHSNEVGHVLEKHFLLSYLSTTGCESRKRGVVWNRHTLFLQPDSGLSGPTSWRLVRPRTNQCEAVESPRATDDFSSDEYITFRRLCDGILAMETLYSAAQSIVNRAQPSLDGGIVTFALNNLVTVPLPGESISSKSSHASVTDHVLSTLARTGYALAITFGLIWTVALMIAAIFVCRQRSYKKRQLTGTIYVPRVNNPITRIPNSGVRTTHSSAPIFYRARERLQSNWICLAVQFFFFVLLAVLLITGVLLGFAVSSQLHTNLAAPPTDEEAVGRLLTSAELKHTHPSRTHVFPRVLRGLAQIRAYLSEFVYHTKNDTEPVVRELIGATEMMQDNMTVKFNTLLFDQIGVTEAFTLGDQLGANVISLINHSMSVVELDKTFKRNFDLFKVNLQTWLRLISTYGPVADDKCVDRCPDQRDTFLNNLTARPDSFMPNFDFAIALKFVTTDQNQTAESVQNQLNAGKVLAAKQLTETKKIMAERINIPASVRAMTNEQWDLLESQLSPAIQNIDNQAEIITRTVAPKVSSGSSIFLAMGCLLWILLLLLTIGILWLIIHYHCVPGELSSHGRNHVRTAAACGFVILSVSMFCATLFFLVGGYMFTEVCRYVQPDQKRVAVVDHDQVANGNYTQELMFPLDAHINLFVNKHWRTIKSLADRATPNNSRPMPLPHIRSPIYAVTHHCRENKGILEAMDAVRDFDVSAMNDPKMAERFINIGREIMLESLKAIEIDEMFPKETEEQLAMAGRLDDFIIDFDALRHRLPVTYVSIRPPGDDSGNYTLFSVDQMWNIWNAYYSEVLQHRLSEENNARLVLATEKVRQLLSRLDSTIILIAKHLTELSKAKKVGPTVVKLNSRLQQIKTLMTNKPGLLKLAVNMFDEHIQKKTPVEAEKLIVRFAPKLMSKVGRCRRLYEAAEDFNGAVCDGIVGVLNGFWFVTGWMGLIGMLSISCCLLLLLHKSPVDTTTGRRPSFLKPIGCTYLDVYARESVNSKSVAGGYTTTPTELDHLNVPDHDAMPPRLEARDER